jgi:cyclophilin family peptidyl-prolyl cis-trans isomerase
MLTALPLAAIALSALLAPPAAAPPPAMPTVSAEAPPVFIRMTTNRGEILLELDAAKAPITVANFLAYARKGHYDGTVFHRVIPGFMIQGGGFDAKRRQKATDPPIRNESGNGLSNRRGTIAMARTGDPDSATAQFFINTVDNPNLDPVGERPGYAVFGRVVSGIETIDAIRLVPTAAAMAETLQGPSRMQDWPVEAMVIEKVEVVKRPDASAADEKPAAVPEKPAKGEAPTAPPAPPPAAP